MSCSLRVPAGTEAGRYEEAVVLHTNHPKFPTLPVGVNLFVRHDLYANPESIDFTAINLATINEMPDAVNSLYEVVMLKKRQGDFAIKGIQADVPFLKITQSPNSGRSSSFKLDVGVVKEKLTAGQISGKIRIKTDDRKFPEILIPVTAEIR